MIYPPTYTLIVTTCQVLLESAAVIGFERSAGDMLRLSKFDKCQVSEHAHQARPRPPTETKTGEAISSQATAGQAQALMPSVSDKQRRAMRAAAAGQSTLGIPRAVGRDFVAADRAKAHGRGMRHVRRKLAKRHKRRKK